LRQEKLYRSHIPSRVTEFRNWGGLESQPCPPAPTRWKAPGGGEMTGPVFWGFEIRGRGFKLQGGAMGTRKKDTLSDGTRTEGPNVWMGPSSGEGKKHIAGDNQKWGGAFLIDGLKTKGLGERIIMQTSNVREGWRGKGWGRVFNQGRYAKERVRSGTGVRGGNAQHRKKLASGRERNSPPSRLARRSAARKENLKHFQGP